MPKAAAERSAAILYFVPTLTMLYRIKLQYAFHVDAASKAEAFQKACKAIRENPGSHIAEVAQPDTPAGKGGLLKRVWTGK